MHQISSSYIFRRLYHFLFCFF